MDEESDNEADKGIDKLLSDLENLPDLALIKILQNMSVVDQKEFSAVSKRLRDLALNKSTDLGKIFREKLQRELERGILLQDEDAIRLVLGMGADVNVDGSLQRAADRGFLTIVNLLLNAGADVNSVAGNEQRTALHCAVINNDEAIVQRLLEAGANPNLPDRTGWAPLHDVSESVNIARLLLHHGATVDIVHQKFLTTPLQRAVEHKNSEVAALLLASGAHVNATNIYGCTALFYAASSGQTSTVQLLLDSGADIRACDENKRTVLFNAALNGRVETVKLLLQKGVDVSAVDLQNKTVQEYVRDEIEPLFVTEEVKQEMVELLRNAAEVKNIGPGMKK